MTNRTKQERHERIVIGLKGSIRSAEKLKCRLEEHNAPKEEMERYYEEYDNVKTATACIEMCARMAEVGD